MMHGKIWGWMERIGDGMAKWLGRSRTLRCVAHWGMEEDRLTSHSGICRWFFACLTKKRLRRNTRPAGFFASLGKQIGFSMLRSSVDTWGTFLVIFSGFSVGSALMLGGRETHFIALLPYLVLLAASLPLLRYQCSLSYAIRHSRILRGFFIGYCGIFEEEFLLLDEGERRWGTALLLGGATAALSLRFSTAPLILGAMIPLLLLILSLPELLLLFLAAAFPFLGRTGHPTVILGITVFLLELVWLRKLRHGQRGLRFGLRELLIFFFGAITLLGGWISAGGGASLLSGTVSAFLIWGYFPSVSLLSGNVWRKRVVDALHFGGSICALWGIVEYVSSKAELKWVDVTRFSDIGGRVCSFFPNPNVLAIYLLLLIPTALAVAVGESAGFVRRCCYVFVFTAEVVCLALTWTRGAWLGCIASMLLLLLLLCRRSRGILTVTPFFCLAGIPFLPSGLIRRFSSIGSMTDSSTRYRLYTWKGVARMLSVHPWGIGVGESAFASRYPIYAVTGTERVMHAHQIWLQVGTETGWLGVFLLLGVFCCLMKTAVRCGFLCDGIPREQAMGAVCGLLGALIMGLFDHLWYFCGMQWMIWLISALLTASLYSVAGEKTEG